MGGGRLAGSGDVRTGGRGKVGSTDQHGNGTGETGDDPGRGEGTNGATRRGAGPHRAPGAGEQRDQRGVAHGHPRRAGQPSPDQPALPRVHGGGRATAGGRLPEGGEHRSPAGESESNEELCDRFFATSSAAPFTDSSHRELLLELFETGTGDPLRWSTARVKQAIGGVPYSEDSIPLEVALDAPDLLRAFIPYAHAQSGIRDELTAPTLAMVDALRSRYKRDVLRQSKHLGLDDAV